MPIFNCDSEVMTVERFRKNEWSINDSLIRMSSVLVNLVWFFDSCFNICLTSFHFGMFSYDMIFLSILRTDYSNTIFVPTLEHFHIYKVVNTILNFCLYLWLLYYHCQYPCQNILSNLMIFKISSPYSACDIIQV